MNDEILNMDSDDIPEFLSKSDQEAYVVTDVLQEKLLEYYGIIQEKNPSIPFAFVMALDLMGKTLDVAKDTGEYKSIMPEESKSIRPESYETVKEDMLEFINVMFEHHNKTAN